MITIEHCTTRKGLKYYACDQLQHDTNAFMYALGQEPPNYQLPAIRTELEYWKGYNQEVVAVTLFNDEQECVAFWP